MVGNLPCKLQIQNSIQSSLETNELIICGIKLIFDAASHSKSGIVSNEHIAKPGINRIY